MGWGDGACDGRVMRGGDGGVMGGDGGDGACDGRVIGVMGV